MTHRIVLGMQGTVDYEANWDVEHLSQLIQDYGVVAADIDEGQPVTSVRSLLGTLLAFIRSGKGTEKHVRDSSIIREVAARLNTQVTLGGTSVRAALAMRILGVSSLLHLVSTDPIVRRLLPADCPYICSATSDTLDPHLIIQFPGNTRVTVNDIDIQSPQPNRVIFANDPPAEMLLISDELEDHLKWADLFLISGLNTIQSRSVLEERIDTLLRLTGSLPNQALIYYEDAGFHSPDFGHIVREKLVPHVDVYGLNEDELEQRLAKPINIDDPESLTRGLQRMRTMMPRKVTMVLHTRLFALALGPRADELREALRGGVHMASTRYIYGDNFDRECYIKTSMSHMNPRGVRIKTVLERKLAHVAVEPGLDLTSLKPTTVGLGDTFVGGFIAALDRGTANGAP